MAAWRELSGEHDFYFKHVQQDLEATADYVQALCAPEFELDYEERFGDGLQTLYDPSVPISQAVSQTLENGTEDIDTALSLLPDDLAPRVVRAMIRDEMEVQMNAKLRFGCDTVGFGKRVEIEVVREGVHVDAQYNLTGSGTWEKTVKPGDVLSGKSRQVITAPLLGGKAVLLSLFGSKTVTGLYDKETGEPNVQLRVFAKEREYGQYEREIQTARWRRQ